MDRLTLIDVLLDVLEHKLTTQEDAAKDTTLLLNRMMMPHVFVMISIMLQFVVKILKHMRMRAELLVRKFK